MASKNRLTREQAAEIYDQLRNSMEKRYGKKGLESLMEKERALKGASGSVPLPDEPAVTISPSMKAAMSRQPSASRGGGGSAGVRAAFALVICVAGLKTGLSALEATGFADVATANASMPPISETRVVRTGTQYSSDEVQLLKTLDARRVTLEERNTRLDQREAEIAQKDREIAGRLAELRDLTHQLEGERKKSERKQDAQLDQLANVYGSMNPAEAAQLIEQLDVTISLRLLERMPEKRIAQILATMSPERALTITRLLSGDRG
jgi:flagellar motility protein MotE (MotC chaperone)